MKSRHKYLCFILPFVLLFTTAFAQQPTAPADGQDTAQIAEQHQPDITVQSEATPGVSLEVTPEETPNQTTQPESESGQASDDVQGDTPDEEEAPETHTALQIKTNTISAGFYHSVKIGAGGSVWAAGDNTYGQLGCGELDSTNSSKAVRVKNEGGQTNFSDVVAVSADYRHSLAIKSDGSVWAWGYNGNGQIGDNTTIDRFYPVQVKDPSNQGYFTNAVQVSAGKQFSLALKEDGSVYSWGWGDFGQLGQGISNKFSKLPTAVYGAAGGSLTDIIQIASGGYHCLALKSDGTVWAWGKNENGQLGNGTTEVSGVPVQVNGLTDVVAISAGENHSLALKADGTVWAWGANNNGQIGDDSRYERAEPVQVRSGSGYLTGVKMISAGSNQSFAIKVDGALWGWGTNYYGQLGDTTNTTRNMPVRMAGPNGVGYMENVVEVSAGYRRSMVLQENGDDWFTGENHYGEHGNGGSDYIKLFPEPGFWIDDISGDITPGEASIDAQTGQEYTITATASGITAQGATFQLIYDATKLELTDFMLQRYETVTGPGVYGNLTVQSAEPGKVIFFLNTTIPEGLTWSGLLSKIKFTAVSDGQTAVELKTI